MGERRLFSHFSELIGHFFSQQSLFASFFAILPKEYQLIDGKTAKIKKCCSNELEVWKLSNLTGERGKVRMKEGSSWASEQF